MRDAGAVRGTYDDGVSMPPSDGVPSRIVLRPERWDEAAAVRSVVEEAFGDDGAVVGQLVDTLRGSPDCVDGLSFVAAEDGRLVGHLLFTRSLLDAPRRLVDVLVLSPLSVRPGDQRRGIGSALVRHGLAEVARRPEPLVFVEGDPGYYGRFGFVAGGSLGFRRPSLRIPEAAFQVLPLDGHEPWMTGTLVYSRVFWDLDCVGLRDPTPT
jgi:putative acetyltransferase